MEQEYEKNENYVHRQVVEETGEEDAIVYDKEENFKCINWYSCQFCPGFNSKYCL